MAVLLLLSPGPAQEPGDPPPFPLPRAKLAAPEFDWGSVVQGELLHHTFVLRNEGTAPLKVLKVTSNCGCTSTHFSDEIAPGEEGSVTLEIDTSDLFGEMIRKNATIFTNDPAAAQLTTWLKGAVVPILVPSSALLKISGLYGEEKAGRFQLLPGTPRPTVVVEASSRGGHFQVSDFSPIAGGGVEVELVVGAAPLPAPLRDELQVQVRLGDGEPVTVRFPVVIEHLDRVRFTPAGAIVFYRRQTAHLEKEPPREVAHEVHLRATRADMPISVLDAQVVDAPEGLFATEVRTVVPGQHYIVKIAVLKTMDESQVEGRLVVRFDDPVLPTRERNVLAQFRLRLPSPGEVGGGEPGGTGR